MKEIVIQLKNKKLHAQNLIFSCCNKFISQKKEKTMNPSTLKNNFLTSIFAAAKNYKITKLQNYKITKLQN